jgi:hypothetical protein
VIEPPFFAHNKSERQPTQVTFGEARIQNYEVCTWSLTQIAGVAPRSAFPSDGSTVVPSLSSPADLAGNFENLVVAGLRMWESR